MCRLINIIIEGNKKRDRVFIYLIREEIIWEEMEKNVIRVGKLVIVGFNEELTDRRRKWMKKGGREGREGKGKEKGWKPKLRES